MMRQVHKVKEILDDISYIAIGSPLFIAYKIAMLGEHRCPECGYRIRTVCTLCGAGRR